MAVDEQRLLDLVQHLILHVPRHLGLQKLEAKAMNCADVHLGEPSDLTERLVTAIVNALLELRGGLFRERKRYDVERPAPCTAVRLRRQEGHDTSSDHLGLSRAGARDELKVPIDMTD